MKINIKYCFVMKEIVIWGQYQRTWVGAGTQKCANRANILVLVFRGWFRRCVANVRRFYMFFPWQIGVDAKTCFFSMSGWETPRDITDICHFLYAVALIRLVKIETPTSNNVYSSLFPRQGKRNSWYIMFWFGRLGEQYTGRTGRHQARE